MSRKTKSPRKNGDADGGPLSSCEVGARSIETVSSRTARGKKHHNVEVAECGVLESIR